MRHTMFLLSVVLLSSGIALAQAGTNVNSSSQSEIKPGTGRAGEILLSPDINQYLTGNIGYTEGSAPDVTAFNSPATAGAVSGGAESTAAVSSAEQMTKQFIEDRVGRSSGNATSSGPLPPNAFNEGARPTQTKPEAKPEKAASRAPGHDR
jgi:hypothetical protein